MIYDRKRGKNTLFGKFIEFRNTTKKHYINAFETDTLDKLNIKGT